MSQTKSKQPKEPRKTVTVSSLPPELLLQVEKLAVKEHRDRSAQIVALLEEAVKNRRATDQMQQAA